MSVQPAHKHDDSVAPSKQWSFKSPRLWGILITLGVLGGLGLILAQNFARLRPLIESMGPWAPLAFILLYLMLAPSFFPLSILDLSCGAIFGVTKGFQILILASALAAMEMFIGSRWLFAGRVSRFIEARPRLRRFYRLAGLKDWKILALLRLSPTNFAVVNYVLGAARVSFTRYMITWLILVPKALLHASIGHAIYRLGHSPPDAGSLARSKSIFIILGSVSALALIGLLGRRIRRALDEIAQEKKITP